MFFLIGPRNDYCSHGCPPLPSVNFFSCYNGIKWNRSQNYMPITRCMVQVTFKHTWELRIRRGFLNFFLIFLFKKWNEHSIVWLQIENQMFTCIKIHTKCLFDMINFANLFYYSTYFYYYSWVSLHFLVLFIVFIIIFQLIFTFIYSIFSKKFSVSTKYADPK